MRLIYKGIIEDSFKSGVEDAWSFWNMTPAEINGRIKARAANNQQKAEQLDMLAFMVGNYVGVAVNNPKKFPDKPNMIKKQINFEPMQEDSMKSVLTAFAEIHNAIEDVS